MIPIPLKINIGKARKEGSTRMERKKQNMWTVHPKEECMYQIFADETSNLVAQEFRI